MARISMVLLVIGALAGCDKGAKGGDETARPAEPSAQAPAAKGAEAPAPEAAAADGTVYGEGVSATDAVDIAAILDDPDAYAGKRVRVEGMITDVCPKRGCWIDMAGKAPGQKLRFKVRDGVMVFPMEAKGKQAVAEGVVAVQELSLEETREYLAYQAEYTGEDFDPASVTEPTKIVRIDGVGAVVR